ncbi:MAG: hypothetical protein ACU84H_00805 [Gammaproteobacteria bacterium]
MPSVLSLKWMRLAAFWEGIAFPEKVLVKEAPVAIFDFAQADSITALSSRH